jgi:hypothetical protein
VDPSASGPDQTDNTGEPKRAATVKWPSISDYWPDRPWRRRPAADHSLLQPAVQPRADDGARWIGGAGVRRPPVEPRPGGLRLVLGFLLAASLLVVAGAVVATLIKQAHREPVDAIAVPSAATPGQGAQAATQPTPDPSAATGAVSFVPIPASVPVPVSVTRTTTQPPSRPAAATFELVSGSPAVTVHTRNLGADLYRVTVAKGSGAVPKISSTGAVHRLTLTGGEAPVDITLSANIRWTVRLTGGISQSVLDFGDSSPAAIDLAGGASRIELTLPRPTGTLPVRLTKGVSELRVHIGTNVSIRLILRVGASQVVLDGRTHNGVAQGTILTTPGWTAARNRIDLDAVAGMSLLTVDEG